MLGMGVAISDTACNLDVVIDHELSWCSMSQPYVAPVITSYDSSDRGILSVQLTSQRKHYTYVRLVRLIEAKFLIFKMF